MLPLRPDKPGLDDLRRTIARMQAPAVTLDGQGDCPLGIPEVDRALGGGLACGALHEIAACGEAHIAAATGFVLGLANISVSFRGPSEAREPGIHNHSPGLWIPGSRPSAAPRNDNGKFVVWVAEDMALLESGAPYGPGLDCHGLAPERLLTVAGARTGDVLWAMEEALHCRAVGTVIGEVRGASRELDLVATRRLSLAAAAHGAMALLLRTAPGTEASAAATRWVVGAGPSLPSHPGRACARPGAGSGGGGSTRAIASVGVGWTFVEAPFTPTRIVSSIRSDLPPPGGGKARSLGGIGPPRFDLALTRNRRGPLGSWMLEWSVSDVSFALATHPQPVAGTAVDRPDTRAA